MRVATIVGTRAQFVKAAPVSVALAARGHEEHLIHTGQHYGPLMSDVFFEELPLPTPELNLGVGSGKTGWQVAETLLRTEQALADLMPDIVVVYGDASATLGGALAARKAPLPLAHVEAGLRSGNRAMPEEDNRILTDHAADLLLCPTPTAMKNLRREGLAKRAKLVGDTMCDAVRRFLPLALEKTTLLEELGLESGRYFLATVHRNYNTEDPVVLGRLVQALAALDLPVVFLVHPRTRKTLAIQPEAPGAASSGDRIIAIEPRSYLETLLLQSHAAAVLTDSGGMQKEAMLVGTPCVTLRPETEWPETVESGWNVLAGSDPERIVEAVSGLVAPKETPDILGDGAAAEKVVAALERKVGQGSGA